MSIKWRYWWWYYPTPSKGWGRGETPRRPNSRATPQGLDHRSRIEREEPKIDLRRGSEAGQSRRKWLRSCRGCPQALQAEFSFRLILWRYEDKRLWPWQRRRESSLRMERERRSSSEWRYSPSASRMKRERRSSSEWRYSLSASRTKEVYLKPSRRKKECYILLLKL